MEGGRSVGEDHGVGSTGRDGGDDAGGDDNAQGSGSSSSASRWSQTGLPLVLRIWACDDVSIADSSTFMYPSYRISHCPTHSLAQSIPCQMLHVIIKHLLGRTCFHVGPLERQSEGSLASEPGSLLPWRLGVWARRRVSAGRAEPSPGDTADQTALLLFISW